MLGINAKYSGEREMAAIRIKELLLRLRRGLLPSLYGKHRAVAHKGTVSGTKCTTLAVEGDISAKKALEAFWTFKRNPVTTI